MRGPSTGGPPRREGALLERSRTLGPEPRSAGEARRFVREALVELELDEWLDACELAVSEVVTNATLHARTDIDLRVGVYAEEVCIEVRDFEPTFPAPRHYDDEATTGRGLELVAAVTRACGVQSLAGDGKVVWFCVGSADVTAEEARAPWDVDQWAPEPGEGRPTSDVVLPAMPATLWLSARQHHDAILRELVLYLAEHEAIDADLAAADRARGMVSTALLAAIGGGTEPPPDGLDLRVAVPEDAGPMFAALQDVLDVAEALAVEGALFTHPALPEIVAVRDWACEQVIAQLNGVQPAPWPGTAQERFETAVHDRVATGARWDPSSVVDAVSPAVAADAANRIVAVSRPLVDLLGWEAHELVGRRVVTIVPPALREAHVAGFSRHLTTGEAHVLGRTLELPVLRKDGSEVRCRLLVETAPDAGERLVYVAWIDPVDQP